MMYPIHYFPQALLEINVKCPCKARFYNCWKAIQASKCLIIQNTFSICMYVAKITKFSCICKRELRAKTAVNENENKINRNK